MRVALRRGAGAAAASLLLAGCTVSSDREPLPDVTLVEFDGGRPVELRGLEGPMLINFWNSTCPSCIDEMPVLEEFHHQHGDEVAVVGIDFQEPQARAARALVEETGVTYRLLLDELGDLNGAEPLPNFQALPLQVYVDEDGEVAFMAYEPFESLGEVEASVDEHLGIDL